MLCRLTSVVLYGHSGLNSSSQCCTGGTGASYKVHRDGEVFRGLRLFIVDDWNQAIHRVGAGRYRHLIRSSKTVEVRAR